MEEVLLQCAQVLWDFSRLNQILRRSEVMIVLGNDDPRCAQHAADLFLEGWTDFVLISGKEGTGTRGKLPMNKTEADVFCEIMVSKGVPFDRIFLELEATNTGENIRFSQRMLERTGLIIRSVMLVTKSLMERRAALTFQKQWVASEKVHLCVSSPPLSLMEYPSSCVGTMDEVVVFLMEIFEKFTDYAECGHQAAVEIPGHVQRAYSILAAQKHRKCWH
ncbi:unnamed protein product [Candidula unifasciata]|uniref:DUF218 domain-containing protein n=1 Tax=Candidula unifasciata TaxID=100452 RepID=A0A8S3Z478_9EUPU|nr:unnamed protein product [Candidula unifasciata]